MENTLLGNKEGKESKHKLKISVQYPSRVNPYQTEAKLSVT